jgi:hypothetical protein
VQQPWTRERCAGVQSSTLLILAARRELEPLDGAVFADTGWEPAEVYRHLDRLEREVAGPAGIPIYRVSRGNIRRDALDPGHRFASMPLHVRRDDGGAGMARRQCTGEYKLRPIKQAVRAFLGAPPRPDGVPGRVPRGRWVEQWIGISLDEQDRALGADGRLNPGDVSYSWHRYPLLELGLTRADCQAINRDAGFDDVPKSACIGCPFHTNRAWRTMRDTRPDEWADAVAFDHAIRHGAARANAQGNRLRGHMYLHRARVPLDQAPIDPPNARGDRRRHGAGHEAAVITLEESLADDSALNGCSPYACRDTAPARNSRAA